MFSNLETLNSLLFAQLMAKLAADRIKPNACCLVKEWKEFLDTVELRDLPGIGRKMQKKLQPRGLCTVNDVWELGDDAEHELAEIIGRATAHKIVQYCHGKDDRAITPAKRKSIGAECNYGVRFDGSYGVNYMMKGLGKEVNKRMAGVGVRGSKLVLKMMISKDPTKMPGKWLGHGLCDSVSRSVDIPLTRDEAIISSAGMKLYEKLAVDDSSIRGMGIVINALKFDDELNLVSSPTKLSSWLQNSPEVDEEDRAKQVTFEIEGNDTASTAPTLPTTFSQLDQDVLSNLPSDILMEVKSMYGRKSSQQSPRASGASPKSTKLKCLTKSKQSDKAISIEGQTSVRRMLKLACVKSGDEQIGSNDITLSQLDCLPLEVQLQIANGDDIEISKKPKHRAKRVAVELHPLMADQDELDDETEVVLLQSLEIECHERDEPINNFHDENIVPLKQFVSSNPNPDSHAVETVTAFLSLCINESRIDDTVIFLRTIKNMQNSWGGEIYKELKEVVLHKMMRKTGYKLDVMWLGL